MVEFENYSLYDSDGLLGHHNEVQRRLVSIFATHKKQVNHLKRDLYLTRMALCRSKLAHHNPHQTNTPNLCTDGNNMTDNGERRAGGGHGQRTGGKGGSHSGGCNSSVQSDASSWEAVDEKEAKPTLWVPDHAVTSCMRCHTQFWFGRRKHHCRNCGQLFCSECSDNLAPIPTEQLYHPVRICEDCFQKLYPEEAAQKARAAIEALQTNPSKETNVINSDQQESEIVQSRTEQDNLKDLSNMSDEITTSNTEIIRDDVQKILSLSDNQIVVANGVSSNKQNPILEGEASLILNCSDSHK